MKPETGYCAARSDRDQDAAGIRIRNPRIVVARAIAGITNAHFERRLIVERTLDGVAAARKRGRHQGRPYTKDETVSALKNLVDAGMTPAQAAKHLGIGRSTAYRIARKLQTS